MGSKISEVASKQVNAEKERLEQDKYIAETEKNLYIKVFSNLIYITEKGISYGSERVHYAQATSFQGLSSFRPRGREDERSWGRVEYPG